MTIPLLQLKLDNIKCGQPNSIHLQNQEPSLHRAVLEQWATEQGLQWVRKAQSQIITLFTLQETDHSV